MYMAAGVSRVKGEMMEERLDEVNEV